MTHASSSPAAMSISRRAFFATTAGAAALAVGIGRSAARATHLADTFVLPDLGYAYDALEPHIDTLTMNVHHTRHHGAFIANLNRLVPANPVLAEHTAEELLAGQCAIVPESIRTAVRNNLGGHVNHALYWEILNPADRAAEPHGALKARIDADLSGFDKAKELLTASAMQRFGSGWAWLVVRPDRSLAVLSTANQDSPLMGEGTPILGIDVWEHAYYLKHQNRRADYVAAFWEVLNWRVVSEKYEQAIR